MSRSSREPPTSSFTEQVRQELARLPLGRPSEQAAELEALIQLGGALHLQGGDVQDRLRLEVTTSSGAVARRVFSLLGAVHRARAELRVEEPAGVRGRRFAVVVDEHARTVAGASGLLDAAGRPARPAPQRSTPAPTGDAQVAYARGALLAAGSISAPGRAAHLEIRVGDLTLATAVAEFVGVAAGHTATVVAGERGARVVLKSGDAVGQLLAAVGATSAYLRWEERRLRRQLRADATRLANADAANLRRAIEAASAQVAEVAQTVEAVGWEALDRELREVALARLANPSASLTELGELLDPPVGKSTVHRRLARLRALARGRGDGGDGSVRPG